MTGRSEEQNPTAPRAFAARLGHALARPVPVAIAALVALVTLGWIYLALMVAGWATRGSAVALGPGMGLFDLLTQSAGIDIVSNALLDALCRPTFGRANAGTWGLLDFALVFLMWAAMTLAMMLPTAGPMIVTYAEISEAAARKGQQVVSPLVVMTGYAVIWLSFAIVATALQLALTRLALLDPAMASASPLFSGAIFLGAGAYQFSALKHACVTRCQRPFPFFLANWSTDKGVIFRLGLRQGLYCLGCCWAMMLVMFAVGVMNVVWMAALGLLMTGEKLTMTTRFSRVIGVAFGLIGIAFIVTAVIAHWPNRL